MRLRVRFSDAMSRLRLVNEQQLSANHLRGKIMCHFKPPPKCTNSWLDKTWGSRTDADGSIGVVKLGVRGTTKYFFFVPGVSRGAEKFPIFFLGSRVRAL